jgi:hypothetical protein
VVALTALARRHAGANGLEAALATLILDPACVTGDLVSLSSGGERHDFSVIRRRWTTDPLTLEITLDHPVRHGGR